jgi:hypothetical protein
VRALVQAVKRRGRALGWLAALLAMYPGGPQLKVKGGGGLAAIARQKKLQVRLYWPQQPSVSDVSSRVIAGGRYSIAPALSMSSLWEDVNWPWHTSHHTRSVIGTPTC